MFAAGLRPSVLDFLDGATLELLAAGYPLDGRWSPDVHAGVPPGAGFALVVELDGARRRSRPSARS